MHRLASTFVPSYHRCDRQVGERILPGKPFRPSDNDYDWLGPVFIVIELGLCLDLTTSTGIEWVKIAYDSLAASAATGGVELPRNTADRPRRHLDCAVIRRLHSILNAESLPAVDTLKGVFTEGKPIYPDAGFDAKPHIQIAVRNLDSIKGVFRLNFSRLVLRLAVAESSRLSDWKAELRNARLPKLSVVGRHQPDFGQGSEHAGRPKPRSILHNSGQPLSQPVMLRCLNENDSDTRRGRRESAARCHSTNRRHVQGSSEYRNSVRVGGAAPRDSREVPASDIFHGS